MLQNLNGGTFNTEKGKHKEYDLRSFACSLVSTVYLPYLSWPLHWNNVLGKNNGLRSDCCDRRAWNLVQFMDEWQCTTAVTVSAREKFMNGCKHSKEGWGRIVNTPHCGRWLWYNVEVKEQIDQCTSITEKSALMKLHLKECQPWNDAVHQRLTVLQKTFYSDVIREHLNHRNWESGRLFRKNEICKSTMTFRLAVLTGITMNSTIFW
jgi:hypothetical protein